MSITVPPFTQYQASIIPIRGLWNNAPPEGDRFINVELDWPQGSDNCVQVNCGANSPVSFSQIVALAVDNSRNNAPITFIFSVEGTTLNVPAGVSGIYPVFTNGTSFYASSPLALNGSVTIVQILNSMPPPIDLQPVDHQIGWLGGNGFSLTSTGKTAIIISGITTPFDNAVVTEVDIDCGDISTAGVANIQVGSAASSLLAVSVNIEGEFGTTFSRQWRGLNVPFDGSGTGYIYVTATTLTTGSGQINLYGYKE